MTDTNTKETMDLLDHLLKHDAWTTRRLMALCLPLSDDELGRDFALGPGTLRKLWQHVVRNVEVWTALMAGDETIIDGAPADAPLSVLIERYDHASAALFALARRITDEGRFDGTFVDHLDHPPRNKTFGGAILHLATHGMHHRAQALYMMRRLGIENVPEGDALSWENQHRKS
ncbi:MAG: DinB family protein [Planctomycetota bacterium]